MNALQDKVAIVTGAGRGLGRAIALALAEAGAHVACGARTKEAVEETAAAARTWGVQALALPLDVRHREEVGDSVEQIVAVLGRIDILVNNAGLYLFRPTLEMSEEEWRQVLDTNLTGTFFCSQAVGRHMVTQQQGKIINIGSFFGAIGIHNSLAYSASKAGMSALTRCLAVEWAKYNIQVNCIAPGYFATVINAETFADERAREIILAKIPLRRFGQPEELGPLVIYLASPASDFVTGQTILIDGGETIAW